MPVGQIVTMPDMENMFFQFMLRDQWLLEQPDLHKRMSEIKDPEWQATFVSSINSEKTAVNVCTALLKQYDEEQQAINDLMQDGGRANYGSSGACQIIQTVEDAADQIRAMPDTPDAIDDANRLVAKCSVMHKEWESRLKYQFNDPDDVMQDTIAEMINK